MGIENEMLARFNQTSMTSLSEGNNLSTELDFFFDNVLDTVVEFFTEKEELMV